MDNHKLTICKHCGATIAKSAKICPYCGGRNKKSKLLLVMLLLLILVIGYFVFIILASSQYTHELSDDVTTMSKKEYKAACEKITYDDLARNADNMIGRKVKFTGEVQQVVLDADNLDSEYRVGVTKSEYDWYTADDVIYLYYYVGDNSRILLNDIITFYGEVAGYEEYTSTAGINVKIPAVIAAYVSIKNE